MGPFSNNSKCLVGRCEVAYYRQARRLWNLLVLAFCRFAFHGVSVARPTFGTCSFKHLDNI